MKYLKLFESFGSGVEELEGYPWRIRNDFSRQCGGTDFFTKRELGFFREFFVKSDKNDFFRISGEKLSGRAADGTPLSGERRSTFRARYMPVDNRINPIDIRITRFKDDYFMVEISCMSNEDSRFSEYSLSAAPKPKIYLVDSFEDMKDFLFDIRKYWKDINDSWKPQNESIKYNNELWNQITAEEKGAKLDSVQETFDENEIIKVQAFINSLNNLSLEFYVEDFSLTGQFYLEHNLIVVKHYMSMYDLCIYKLRDDWFIVSFEVASLQSPYSVNFLCDQLDAVEQLIKLSTDDDKIEIPFDYIEMTSRGYPRTSIKSGTLSRQCADLIRQKIKEYDFNVDYDEIFPITTGSGGIKFWKALEYSDLSKDAIDFFNIRREPGRRIAMITLRFTEYEGGYIILNWGLGPELSMKHISFECHQLGAIRSILDDKLSMLGK